MQAHLGTIVCKFVRDPSICLQEEAIFVTSQKCPYHVTFDLDIATFVYLCSRHMNEHDDDDLLIATALLSKGVATSPAIVVQAMSARQR